MKKDSARTAPVFAFIFAIVFMMLAGLLTFLSTSQTAAASSIITAGKNVVPGGDVRLRDASEASAASSLSVHKTADPATAKEGETITYTYQVTNTGGISVTSIVASDDLLGAIFLGASQIEAGASVSGTLTYTVMPGDLPGPIINTATVSGTVGASTAVVASDTITVSLSHQPAITVEIASNTGITSPGNTVTYTYGAKNVGDVTLKPVTVTDSRFGPIVLDVASLAPGATASGSKAYFVHNHDIDLGLNNTAVAEGVSMGGAIVNDEDSISVLVTGPTITYTTYIPANPSDYPAQPCQNIVVNSSFEDSSGWVLPVTAYTAAYSTAQQNSGTRSVRTGILDQTDNIFSYSSVSQTVTIPAEATVADLSYHLWPQTSETTVFNAPAQALGIEEKDNQYFNDTQLVLILDSAGNQLARLYAQRRNDQDWIFEEHDLLAFKGQTITLYFGTFNNGSRWQGVTAMFVDDVELNVCASN